MVKYVYPQLSLKKSQDLGLFRLGGPGLANCLFVAARAYLKATDLRCELLRPTWERLSVGQWLRGERDKRFYHGLFKEESFLMKVRKVIIVRFSKEVFIEEGLKDFFECLLARHSEVCGWFWRTIDEKAIVNVPENMSNSVAVHVRLGDFPSEFRVSIAWYVKVLAQIREAVGHDLDVQIFSDGSDDELESLLRFPGARRVFYGNALADIVAISRCGLLIGSHSTFSGWGADLGQVPSIFKQIDYGRILKNSSLDQRIGDEAIVPNQFLKAIKKVFL